MSESDIPQEGETYEGPDRDPSLAILVDQLIAKVHHEQPVTINELLHMVRCQLYRLRGSLHFMELAHLVTDILNHNEHHIRNGEWLLVGPDGEQLPLITPEWQEEDPEGAEVARQLMRLSMGKEDISVAELTDE